MVYAAASRERSSPGGPSRPLIEKNAMSTLRQTPRVIYRKDYTPPPFLVESVDLLFNLDDEATVVTSTLRISKNPAYKGREEGLKLDGEQLKLRSIKINGIPLMPEQFTLNLDHLMILNAPNVAFDVEVVTEVNPLANTALEGLYLASDLFCTQCEAQGFRKITYYPDRPDVMAVFTTTLMADKSRYPVLLSNGNLEASGDLLDGRHFARWVDPFRKPSYLFALVAGKLTCLQDDYTTASGRHVTLQVFAEATDIDKCHHAMASLINAMRWDESRFGREYDLDLYMIVAVSHFNMGAMENKGLNIFNTKYVLARPETATDSDYEYIEGVIGHEYFHNWTGNRITCRDWFQLSLKEGLTVYRDQEFSKDRHSRPVKRIDEVNMLRTRQFQEDAGPLAHPVRPESFIEINNFYTLTVYEKGAEVVRMLATLLGTEGFRKGTDLFFDRHDGEAVTCEDFVVAMEEANQRDLQQFRRWYEQAGTPEVTLEETFDDVLGELKLTFTQSSPDTPGQSHKPPLEIPMALGLIGKKGDPLPLQLQGEVEPNLQKTRVFSLKDTVTTLVFSGLAEAPVVSALRNFSAPIKLFQSRTPETLGFLLAYDEDLFNRWDAAQQLATKAILNAITKEGDAKVLTILIEAFREVTQKDWEDLAYEALLLTLPSTDYIGSFLRVMDPVAIHHGRETVRNAISIALHDDWRHLYARYHEDAFYQFDAQTTGRRRLKNVCLDYLQAKDDDLAHDLALQQFKNTRTMTDRMAALSAIVNSHHPEKSACLEAFYQEWQGDDLVIGKWFTVQATCKLQGTLDDVIRLTHHQAFDINMPNHVRSLIGGFSQSNPVNFHAIDGGGYAFLEKKVLALNAINPQIAARMLAAMTGWRRYDPIRGGFMRAALERIVTVGDLSSDVYEVASKALVAET